MPAPNRSGSQPNSGVPMPDWMQKYLGGGGRPLPVDPRTTRKIAPDSYKPGTQGGPNRSGTASSAPTPATKAKPAYDSKYKGLTTQSPATQNVGISTGIDPMSADTDVDTLLGEGRSTMVETEGKDPSKPYTYTPTKSKPVATTAGRSNQKTTTNALGVEQTMTNTGAINMPGLADVDMTGIANFAGPSFPTQGETNRITDGYSFTASEFLTAPKNADGSAFEAPGGTPTTTNIAVNGNTFRPNTFAKGAAGDVGGLDGFKPGGKFAGAPTATEGQSQKDNDTEFGGPDPMAYATSGEEMRRRSTFLDSSGDSLKAMDNVAKGMGMGRGFANVDGEAKAMSSADRRTILQAAPGEAQALKDKWVKALSNEKADEPQTASSAQNPTQPSGTATFNQDMKQDIASAGQSVDFLNDNEETASASKPKVKFNPDSFTNNGLNVGSFQTQKIGL